MVPKDPDGEGGSDPDVEGGSDRQRDLMTQVQQRWETIEHLLERAFEDLEMTDADRPFSLGVRVEAGRWGRPMVRPFGHVARDVATLHEGWRIPEVSIHHEDQGLLRMRAAVPGVAKEDVQVHVGDHSIEIAAESEQARYHELYQTSDDLMPGSARARFRNGLLELTVHRRAAKTGERDVEVE